MAKIRTNFMEIVLKEVLIGKHMYDENGVKILIEDINYQPLIEEVYIKSGDSGYKLSLNANYDFDLNLNDSNRIVPNKGKMAGKTKEK